MARLADILVKILAENFVRQEFCMIPPKRATQFDIVARPVKHI